MTAPAHFDHADSVSPNIEVLEKWLFAETDFERFSREFYEEHGRTFRPEELPEGFSRIHAPFPTNIFLAFSNSAHSAASFSTDIGTRHLEHHYFLPGRDIYINKYPRYCRPDIHRNQYFEIYYVYRGSCELIFHPENTPEQPPARKTAAARQSENSSAREAAAVRQSENPSVRKTNAVRQSENPSVRKADAAQHDAMADAAQTAGENSGQSNANLPRSREFPHAESARMQKGDFLFIPPGKCFQSLVLSDSIILNIGIRKSTFQTAFSDSLPEGSCLGAFFSGALSDEGKPSVNYLFFHTGPDDILHHYVQDLCLSYCTESPYAKNIMNAQLSTLFLLLLQNCSAHVSASYADTKEQVPAHLLPILHHIEMNYTTTSLKETAEKFGFSPDYLNTLFKRAVSVSVGDMILRLKMQKAAELLSSTDMTIAAIAEYLGYENTASLPRSFKKHFGVTPLKYRKEHTIL